MASVMAILLCGGRSVRVGRDKPTLVIDGEMLVERHVRQLRAAGVSEIVAVCNSDNEPLIRTVGVATVLQQGEGMSGAVLTGLRLAVEAEQVWLVCVNDLISDESYLRIAAAECTAIPTIPLERSFDGGYLEIADGRVVRIVEKPPGGCPPGAAANIMIHRLSGAGLIGRMARLLERGVEYEAAINALVNEGLLVAPVAVEHWRAIKTAEDAGLQ